jgi:hypothetical protein
LTTYFHLCGVQLAANSVIERGNYGRMIASYGHFNNTVDQAWRVAVEQTFELCRTEIAPAAPSRLKSAFVFFTSEDAIAQRERLGGLGAILYEVELTEDECLKHVGIFDLITNAYVPNGAPFLPKTEALAHSYWRGDASGTREVLVASDLKIIRRVE